MCTHRVYTHAIYTILMLTFCYFYSFRCFVYRSKSRSVDHGLAAPFANLDSLRSTVEGRFDSVERLSKGLYFRNVSATIGICSINFIYKNVCTQRRGKKRVCLCVRARASKTYSSFIHTFYRSLDGKLHTHIKHTMVWSEGCFEIYNFLIDYIIIESKSVRMHIPVCISCSLLLTRRTLQIDIFKVVMNDTDTHMHDGYGCCESKSKF